MTQSTGKNRRLVPSDKRNGMLAIDIELKDYIENEDAMLLRLSGAITNHEYAVVKIEPVHTTILGKPRTYNRLEVVSGKVAVDGQALCRCIMDSVNAELNVHQRGPKGMEIENWRDLFAVVTPSMEIAEI